MNLSPVDGRLREELKRAIDRCRTRSDETPPKHWYPLTTVSFDLEEIAEAVDSMVSFRTTMGEKTARFERALAEYVGTKHAVMVNSGSSADLLLAFALADPIAPRLRRGDEILIPAVTWPTQVWSAMMAGLQVRLVDIDPVTLNVCPEALERAITPKTRAAFLVHIMGNPCPMDRVSPIAERHGLTVIEDCCEALGAEHGGRRVGSFGSGAAFSFFFSHHITTMEGGAVVTDDDELFERLRILRAHGWTRNVDSARAEAADRGVDARYLFVNWGFNVRPTEVQASFGIHQLAKLPQFTARRDELARRFFGYIDECPFMSRPKVDPQARPLWMAFTLVIDEQAPFSRDDLTAYLEQAGVETRPVVTGNLARQPVAQHFPELRGDFPGAEIVHQRGFYIGVSPMVQDAAMDRLLDTFDGFLRRYR